MLGEPISRPEDLSGGLSMDETEQVSELIGDIHDASLDPAQWPQVLEKTCGYVHALCAQMGAEDAVRRNTRFFFEWGSDPRFLRLLEEVYSRLNPMTVPTMLYAKVGSVLASSDLIPYDELVETRFYKEWIAPQGIVDAVAVTLDKSATGYAALAINRHKKHGRVDDEMRRRVAILAPHFVRAVAIGKTVDLHKVEAAALADTLDGLAAGMFIVDTGARIVHANASGQVILSEGAVFRSISGCLVATDPLAEQALQDAFAAAIHGDMAVGTKGIAVPLTSTGNERFVAHVLPLTSGARRRGGTTYSAVAGVFVRKASLDLPHPLETIANLYKLTSAEMRVMMAIIELGGVPEVAPVLGIAVTTVKAHLQRVFDKTGTNRQADLVKLAAGFMSPLGAPPSLEGKQAG
jgi:DNA-binding CsgD family transcriptional regulator